MFGRLHVALVLLLAGTSMTVGGVLCLAIGAYLALNPVDRNPVPLPAGQAIVLPVKPFGVDTAVVFGIRPADSGAENLLGCVVRSENGRERSPGPSVITAVSEHDLVVDGRTLEPLVATSNYVEDDTIECAGQGVAAAAPLYVAHGTENRNIIMFLSLGFGAVTVVLGPTLLLLGTTGMRRRRRYDSRG